MKVLVTGTAGFIGFHLAQALLARGDEVVGVDNMNAYYDPKLKAARRAILEESAGYRHAEINLEDRDAIRGLFDEARPDAVVNLAAQAGVRYSLEKPEAYVDSNVVGFLNILEGCRAVQPKHLVYASTSSVYGANGKLPFNVHDHAVHQITLYAATKIANEAMAHSYSHLFGFPSTGFRFFTVYGPWGRPDMALFKFAEGILAANAARAHGATAVHVIPHFMTPRTRPDFASASAFRGRNNIEPGAVLFGMFGYLRETKRVLPVIHAFRRLHGARPNVRLLIAGEPVSRDLARLLPAEAEHPAIRRTGFLSEPELDCAAAAIDCCVNLRYPGAGETSGITIRMGSLGVPLILTDNEENSAMPRVSCLRVRPGVAEAAELFDHMSLVDSFPHLARAVGEQAQRHMSRHHALPAVARQYRELLCALAS